MTIMVQNNAAIVFCSIQIVMFIFVLINVIKIAQVLLFVMILIWSNWNITQILNPFTLFSKSNIFCLFFFAFIYFLEAFFSPLYLSHSQARINTKFFESCFYRTLIACLNVCKEWNPNLTPHFSRYCFCCKKVLKQKTWFDSWISYFRLVCVTMICLNIWKIFISIDHMIVTKINVKFWWYSSRL